STSKSISLSARSSPRTAEPKTASSRTRYLRQISAIRSRGTSMPDLSVIALPPLQCNAVGAVHVRSRNPLRKAHLLFHTLIQGNFTQLVQLAPGVLTGVGGASGLLGYTTAAHQRRRYQWRGGRGQDLHYRPALWLAGNMI